MSWRVVYIEKSDYLKLYLDNLKVVREDTEILIPLSDIHTIIVDNQQTVVTGRLLNKLAQYHILLIFCDEKHLPNIYTLAPHSHHQASRVLEKQIQWSADTKGSMWQKIIQIKIHNQASILDHLKNETSLEALYQLLEEVAFADETNREGHAAKLYFKSLFGSSFMRDRDSFDGINSGLNYGYIVLRSAVARTIVAYGLQPSLGIGHHNQYNAFNLADDLIEPFRPIVDLWVNIMCSEDTYLDIKTKQKIVHLISNNKILIGNQKQTILNAIELFVQSFIKAMNENNPDLLVYPANGIAL
ncbi:type II CRISPR-associated endonuclease Cas1 [Pisciglobus halotolerans]|uniref:CRISPR-associated endonuclease Cas1 n=1 Tax=Pisciglobus halotolerans TaxID=745365 RepID=A0A1I3AS96_9LACT|nr:type II CRISPR-associated endonuclease Cas1 [Pisciglobus halotolerans]SFH52609.1 CRISP-associated protein Cas1 [Pisciglobus halotolerans]